MSPCAHKQTTPCTICTRIPVSYTHLKKATGKTFSTMNYYDNPEIIIIKASERNMAQPIITLYDKLLKDDNTTPHPLLNLLIQTKSANARCV